MLWLNRPEVAVVERGDLGDVQALGDGNHGGVGGAEGKVAVDVDEIGGAGVVVESLVDDGERSSDDGPQECRFDARSTGTTQQVSDFCDHRCRHEDLASGEMQRGEQIGARAVVVVVAVGGGHERPGVTDDHSGASEAVGQKVVVVAAEIVTPAGE